jgi:hypothetical protein
VFDVELGERIARIFQKRFDQGVHRGQRFFAGKKPDARRDCR